jgi:CRISPR-associated endonuclease Csn1
MRKRPDPVSLNFAIDNWEKLADKDIRLMVKSALILNQYDKRKTREYFKVNPILRDGKVMERFEIFETIEATATRIELDEKFTRKQLESITDTGIQSILENHLKDYLDEKGNERFDLAFNQEGLAHLNKNIKVLNNGKAHQAIRKVRIFEVGNKFRVGSTGNKKDKYVEAAKGNNLFFAVYWNEEKQKREFETIPLNIVIEHQKQVAKLSGNLRTAIPLSPEKGSLLFVLSPNDLVYVPNEEEMENPHSVDFSNLSARQISRIHKMVSSTLNQCFFLLESVAVPIANKLEFSSLNKMEKDIDGTMIKEVCWKIEVDRLSQIKNILGR